mmetsp:Transcript_62464/g.129749  ORF Transcript_62464/g.129749 Transcript_62464/m.129749 type:complete len:343 (-) Transcript_62464:132-1160(-)
MPDHVVLGELVPDDLTEDDSVEEGRLVLTAHPIPVLPGNPFCQLEGCSLPVYVSREGERFDFCSRTHAQRARRAVQVRPSDVCKLPGCNELVFVDRDGTPFEFCSRSHGREFARAGEAGVEPREDELGGEAVEHATTDVQEFGPNSLLVCVKPGCLELVKRPHSGAAGGRMGRGPTRYNFCSRLCKQEHGLGPDTVPYSTTVPLSRAWYRDQVEAAMMEARLARDGRLDESEPEGSSGGMGSQPEEVQVVPPPMSSFPPEAVSSVMRCQGLMRRLMAPRAKPYAAQWTGRTFCALCKRRIQKGESMVRCYVDPDPSCTWVHVACAQSIVTARGGRPLHPSLQ